MNNTEKQAINSTFNTMFMLHLFVTIMSWVGPFLVDWWVMCIIYGAVLLQFVVFNRCLMNAGHNIEEDKDFTFYAFLLEKLNIHIPRKQLKAFVRSYLYAILATFSYILQEVWMYAPPLQLDYLIA